MGKKLFRSDDKISTPNQLQDYIRVTNPAVWTILLAVVLLLTGFVIASIFTKIETTVDVIASVQSGVATFSVNTDSADARKLKVGQTVRFTTQGIESKIVALESYEAVVNATVLVNIPDGTFSAVVVTDIVSPISFIIN